jgi:hypothetical protein
VLLKAPLINLAYSSVPKAGTYIVAVNSYLGFIFGLFNNYFCRAIRLETPISKFVGVFVVLLASCMHFFATLRNIVAVNVTMRSQCETTVVAVTVVTGYVSTGISID